MVEFKIGKLPQEVTEKLRYLYRLKEKLRLYHNEKGKDFKNGKITRNELNDFQKAWFKPRNLLVCEAINDCKDAMVNDTSTICSINDIEEK